MFTVLFLLVTRFCSENIYFFMLKNTRDWSVCWVMCSRAFSFPDWIYGTLSIYMTLPCKNLAEVKILDPYCENVLLVLSFLSLEPSAIILCLRVVVCVDTVRDHQYSILIRQYSFAWWRTRERQNYTLTFQVYDRKAVRKILTDLWCN